MEWKQFCDPGNWHDLAKLFPRLPDSELDALARDIAANGLLNPIVLFEGKVLDGRNRLLACEKAGVTPRFSKLEPNGISPREFVIAQNLHRRNLTKDQCAALAAKLVPELAAGARERQKEAGKHGVKGGRGRKARKATAQKDAKGPGKSSEQAAQLIGGVSARKVEAAVALEKRSPGTLDKIIQGQWTFGKAVKEIELYEKRNGTKRPLQGDFDNDFKELASALGVVRNGALSRRFGENPFSVLDAGSTRWMNRQSQWLSTIDPVLYERAYQWFAPKGGHIFDPFGSESTPGIVAGCCGYQYTGIVDDQTQAIANEKQANLVQINRPQMILPKWTYCNPDDFDKNLAAGEQYDLVFTSLPANQIEQSKQILGQSVARLKWNRFVVLQVADVHKKDGFIVASAEDAVRPMTELGLYYYNRLILKMDSRGLGYGTLLCFWKGDRDKKAIVEALGVLDSVEDALA